MLQVRLKVHDNTARPRGLTNAVRYMVYDRMAAVPKSYLPELDCLTLQDGLMRGRAERARVSGAPGKVAVAFKGNHPIGWGLVDYRRVVNLYVRPKYRGKGVGSSLLTLACNAAKIKMTRKAVYSYMPAAAKTLRRANKLRLYGSYGKV
jgi:GNAT superfamily N-acetyltransferase